MLADFVLETAVAPGTAATINLAGALAGRRAFAAAFASGAAVFYAMEDGAAWELGIGTFTDGAPDTLARDTVLRNSLGTTARINFTGTVRVYSALPADRAVYTDDDGDLVGVTAAKLRDAAGATTVGAAVLTAADKAAGRAAIDAPLIGAIGSSGLTMATARLLGRATASAGAVEEISVGAGLALAGGELSAVAGINLGTAANSTSGASIDFTSIPAGVRRVNVLLNGVSTSGTSNVVVRLGTSGGVVATGYASTSAALPNGITPSTSESTTGFNLRGGAGSDARQGIVTLQRLTGNVWSATLCATSSATNVTVGAGAVSLSADLDRVRITTIGGTDTFDAGVINISWEF
jgi:hypothetical protein